MENKMDDLLLSILDLYKDSEYPEEFLDEYDLMECLAVRNGIRTFLVQDHDHVSFVAKCYDKRVWMINDNSRILMELDHEGIPKHVADFETEEILISIREYVEGTSLDRYAEERELSQQDSIKICVQLCDILAFLHHREQPVIHRDIKPQNIIVRPDGSVSLIDFDIARVYRSENETDTVFFGTQAYAPPEQYGFSQTDVRSDIYSLGVLLRWLLTGSTKENKNIKVYPPLDKIIRKCTAFSPGQRFSDVSQVKKSLLRANPKSQGIRTGLIVLCGILLAGLLVFGGIKLYQYITYTPFTEDAIPAFVSDSERIQDAVNYMREKYGTSMFDEMDDVASVGDLRAAMINLYGLDRNYVYGINEEMPQENEAYFLPWGWDDGQTVDRDIMIYAAVKVHDPQLVADWSSLKDDNGFYPGVRVAVAFADQYGISKGANRPGDITLGEMALILANTDRVFENQR